jgi:hypothetical protein
MGLQPARSDNLPARSSSTIAAGIVPPPAVTATGWLRPCFVYVQRSTVEFGTIQLSNGRLGCVRFRHFDEREAARLARLAICDDTHSLHTSVSGESSLKIILGSLITEISDKYVGHSMNPFFRDLSLSDCFRTDLLEGGIAVGRLSKGDTDADKDMLSISDILGISSN